MAAVAIEEVTSAAGTVEQTLTPMETRHFRALEKRIERGLSTFREVGEALTEIRDKRLFRLTHLTFESYCRDKWDLERVRAYQLMGAAEVAHVLGEGSVVNEAQARELVPVMHSDPALVKTVWEHVTASGEPITAPRIRDAVREVTGNGHGVVTPAQPTLTDRLVVELSRVTATYRLWAAQAPTAAEKRDVSRALDTLTSIAASA